MRRRDYLISKPAASKRCARCRAMTFAGLVDGLIERVDREPRCPAPGERWFEMLLDGTLVNLTSPQAATEAHLVEHVCAAKPSALAA